MMQNQMGKQDKISRMVLVKSCALQRATRRPCSSITAVKQTLVWASRAEHLTPQDLSLCQESEGIRDLRYCGVAPIGATPGMRLDRAIYTA